MTKFKLIDSSKSKQEIEDLLSKYGLFRLDNFGEPTHILRKEKAGFEKNNVSENECIALKSLVDS